MMEDNYDWSKHTVLRRYPTEWREVPGYSAYAVSREGILVNIHGKVAPKVMGGRLSYTLDQKFMFPLVCTVSSLIVRAFHEIPVEEVLKYDFADGEGPEEVQPNLYMQIVVFVKGRSNGWLFRRQTHEQAASTLLDVEKGNGFILEDPVSHLNMSFGPNQVACVQIKGDDDE
jgi:hypothetical protein